MADQQSSPRKPKSQILLDRSNLKHLTTLSRLGVFGGLGYNRKELEKPFIAVANSWTEANVGHVHLREVAAVVKDGIREEGGLPFEFNTPAPCDATSCGLEAMNCLLPQRDLIADSVEMMVRANSFDGVVFISTCDKIVPGQLMAAARLGLPAIFVTGGPMLPRFIFSPKTFSFKAIDSEYMKTPRVELEETMLKHRCPGPGACTGFGTANTMQCLTEVMGLSLPFTGTTHGVDPEKLRLARESGRRIVAMVQEGLTTEALFTAGAFRNAVKALMAMGGSTNAVLHLLAIAREAAIPLCLDDFERAGREIPCICGVIPSGPYDMLDLHKAGGVPGILKEIEKALDLETLVVTGKKLGDHVREAAVHDPSVIRSLHNPFFAEGSIAILRGNLSPAGSVVKQSAIRKEMLVHSGEARVFNSEGEACEGLAQGKVKDGDVIVIRYEGPKGGPGMRELLGITRYLVYSGKGDSNALVTDGRFSGFTSGPAVGHVCPEAWEGGPIALLQDGDRISIDIPARTLSAAVSEREMERRRALWQPPPRSLSGYLARYARLVGSSSEGAWLG